MEQTFGRYKLLEPLGRGGMAEVFKAKSFGVEGFEKILVIKRIQPELATNQAFVDMFIHEAKLAVRLSHANIVQVFDLGRVQDSESPPAYYIAMEYVAGLDLASMLVFARRKRLTLPVGLCLFVAAETARGLDHAHRRRDEQMRPLGIVHRDVSPQNILLSWEGEVKVTDFGIAKARDIVEDSDEHRIHRIEGKYAYMSPEQARGKNVDARSDIFSLGAVLYELLAGVNAFAAPSSYETLRRVQAAEFPPLELMRTDVSKELAGIVHKALQKDPDNRFENVGRFYEAMLAHMYSSDTRFTAHDLAEFLRACKGPDADGHAESQNLDGLPLITEEPERTPVEVPLPHLEGKSDATSMSPDGASVLGERREIAILAISFGSRSEELSDASRVRIKDTFARYGARLIDETPQQMVTAFGLGDADGRETETAVRCALVLMRQLTTANLSPGAGVHCGRVLLHASGEPVRDSRLTSVVAEAQDLARANERRCAISLRAARHVHTMFTLEPTTPSTRDGLASNAVLIGDVRASDEAIGKFIGRKAQLRRFGEVLAYASKRRPRIVVLKGEQGVGKTRLLYEVSRRLRKGGYDVGFYLTSCPPRGREVPLSGLTAMLEVLCGVREGDSEERVLSVDPRLRALGLSDEERMAVLGQLGASLSGQGGPNLPPLRAAFGNMVQHLCSDRLHVIAWDNAHALDNESLQVLLAVAQRVQNVRSVFAFATRAGLQHPLFELPMVESLQLDELNEEDTAKLLARRTGLKSAPPELIQFCRERAGGHPLFLEELVKELLETKALRIRDNKFEGLRLTEALQVPQPLRTLLSSRVSRLDTAKKTVLYSAAILGDPVDTGILSTMTSMSVQQVERTIAELEDRALIRRAGPSATMLASPMLREAILDGLSSETLRELHAKASAAYEIVYGTRVEQWAHRVALHKYESGDRDGAATLFARSGRQRLRSGQIEAAVTDLLRAFDLCHLPTRTPAELCAWLEDLRNAVAVARSAPALLDILSRALDRIGETGSVAQVVVSHSHAAGMLGSIHQFDAADKHITKAIELAQEVADLKRTVLLAGAEIIFRKGEFGRAATLFQEVSSMGEAPAHEAYRLQLGLGYAMGAIGNRDEGLAYLDKATSLADPADLTTAVERAKIRGLIHIFSRDFESAVQELQHCASLARTTGLSFELALSLHNQGDALLWLESHARADVAFRESLTICDDYGYDRLGAHNRMNIAFLKARVGHTKAGDELRRLVEVAESKGFLWDVMDGRLLIGKLAYELGQDELALKELTELVTLASDHDHQLVEKSARQMLESLKERGAAAGS